MYIVPLSGLEGLAPIAPEGEKSPAAQSSADAPFAQLLKEAVENLQEVQKASELDAYNLAFGDTTDLHNVTIQAAMQQTAIEMTVQLASRAVSAYKEVLQMQI